MWGNCLYQFDFEDYLRWKHKKWELKGEETSMKKEVMVDMTSGRIAPQILKFAMPVLLGLIFQRIYNFADSYIVGHFLGDNALAAVSVAGVGMYLMFSLIIGLTTGVTVVMSQYYGAKEADNVVKTFFSSIYIALGMTIIVTVVGLIVTKPLLIVLQTPDEVLDQAVLYLRLICAGCIGTMLYNWISAVLRSLGNSVVPLVFLGISSLLNIVFDVLFVAVLPLGVGGAAFATVLAQIVSGVACLLYAWKILPMLRIRRDKLKLDTFIGKKMLVYGLPAALQMSIISISDMTLQAVVNTYGTTLVVAYGVCVKVEGLGMQVGDALGTALGTFAGQNTGAKNISRIKAGFRTTFALNAIGYAIVSPLIFILAPLLMRLFTDNQASIGCGVEYMHIFAPFLIGVGTLNLFHNLLRAVGDNDVLVTSLAKDKGLVKIVGLAIANGFAALAGSVYCQQKGFFEISIGTGTMVIGLANVIIGTQLLKRVGFIRSTTAVIIGSIVYKACVSIALLLNDLHIGGLDISIPITASDLKLITSVLFLIILVVSPSGGKKVKSHA